MGNVLEGCARKQGSHCPPPLYGQPGPLPDGLSVVELQGIDNETAVLVVEERLPKSARCITYGLILDLSKLSLEECQTLTAKGYMFFPEDRTLWTPRHLQEQWDQLDEERSASAPVPPPVQTTQTDPPAALAPAETQTDPTPPPRRAAKRKSVVGTAGHYKKPLF